MSETDSRVDLGALGIMINQMQKIIEQQDKQIVYLQNIIENNVTIMLQQVMLQTYSIKQATVITGLGKFKLMNAIKSGQIKFVRDGKSYRISHADLMVYLAGEKQSETIPATIIHN